MTCGTLSPYEVRHYATNLSAFGPESVQRQLTAHVKAGDFSNADAERMRMMRRQQVGMANTLEQFQEIAKERGYKPAWVRQMVKMRKAQGRLQPSTNDNKPLDLGIHMAGEA